MEIHEILQLIQQYGLNNVILGASLLFGSKYIIKFVGGFIHKFVKYFTSINELEKRIDSIQGDLNYLKSVDVLNAVMEALKQHQQDVSEKHDLQMLKRTELISEGSKLADELLHAVSADWVGLYEYCNGSSNLAGIPFLAFQAIVAKGDTLRGIESERRSISRMGTLLVDLYKTAKPFIVITHDKNNYPEANSYILELGYLNGIFIPLPGKSLLGFILVLFKGNIPKGIILKRTLEIYSQKLANLFGSKGII